MSNEISCSQVFISQPIKGKTKEEILKNRKNAIEFLERKKAIAFLDTKFEAYEVIDSYFKDFDGNHLEFLAESISKLAKADTVVFLRGWEKADGCRCEHFIACQYGLHILYIN
jgi:hypothetical protein